MARPITRRPVAALALGDVEQPAHHFSDACPRPITADAGAAHGDASTRYRQPAATVAWAARGRRLELQADHQRWRCFAAERAGQRLRVCRRIEDRSPGLADTSTAWYWAASGRAVAKPWQSVHQWPPWRPRRIGRCGWCHAQGIRCRGWRVDVGARRCTWSGTCRCACAGLVFAGWRDDVTGRSSRHAPWCPPRWWAARVPHRPRVPRSKWA